MQLSAKTQNACLALLELAKRYENPDPVCLKTIAEAQSISSQFLVQILLQLKRGGIVRSTRGASGGYRLAREPSAISLLDVVNAMEGSSESPIGDNPTAKVFCEAWSSAVEVYQGHLASITLESMCSGISDRSTADMYYI